MASHPNGPPPLFATAHAESASGISKANAGAMLNLDDIFGDVMFTPDGDTVFLSEQSAEDLLQSGEGEQVATMASRPSGENGQFVPVATAGGLLTTQLHEGDKPALTMGVAAPGSAPVAAVPYKQAPQARHHLQYATAPKKNKRSSATSDEKSSDRKSNDQQVVERRYVVDYDFFVISGIYRI